MVRIRSRRDSLQRSVSSAHVGNIIWAIKTLDVKNIVLVIVTIAQGLARIPKSLPEELNSITTNDRIGKLEERLAKLELTASENVARDIERKDTQVQLDNQVQLELYENMT